jgi:uncharacterized repeat protein (TIGR03803 family)
MAAYRSCVFIAIMFAAAATQISCAYSSEKVLYSFTGRDGAAPVAGLIADRDGNLYGTTLEGGSDGVGTVFKLAPDGNESVLHSFRGTFYNDGSEPSAGLVLDNAGNLYGTTLYDGKGTTDGTVFRIAPDGKEKILHTFTGSGDGVDGAAPLAAVILDKKGNLYGTTLEGGGGNCPGGCGTVFKISAKGHERVLHAFNSFGGDDGGNPQAALLLASDGNFYGTTLAGGSDNDGIVFKMTRDGTETVLHNFTGFSSASDGGVPVAPLMEDAAGVMYGTTWLGGTSGEGTIFKITKEGTETVLYSFTYGHDGGEPLGSLVMDKRGNLYSTTSMGGDKGCGTIFKLNPNTGRLTVLHTFTCGSDGRFPFAGLIAEKGTKRLLGTTKGGGANGDGVVFEVDR